jgi:thiamine-monophosphate kinase
LSRKNRPRPKENLRVRDLGEFKLIARLQALVESRVGSEANALEIGIGDDAAVWQPRDNARQVVTTDALLEGVHFRLGTTSWHDLGWKALAVNVSDLAAMGASPRYALITLGLPGDTALANVLVLYGGMLDLAERFHLRIVGGDVVSAPRLLLSITAVGEAGAELLRRDAGHPGDLLAVTGHLGASAGGLRLLETAGSSNDEDLRAASRSGARAGRERLIEAHLRPQPRVAEGLALAKAGLRCGLDVSDGLLGDATRLCERSSVGVVIDTTLVPVDPDLYSEFGSEALEMAIAGGEDYELLCAGTPAAIARAEHALNTLGASLTVIGRLVERPNEGPLVQLVDDTGQAIETGSASWDHFRG